MTDVVRTSLAAVGWSDGCLCDFVRVRELGSPVFEIKRVPLDACPVHGVADLCGSEEGDVSREDAKTRREPATADVVDFPDRAEIGHVFSCASREGLRGFAALREDHSFPLLGECGSGPLFYAVMDLSDPARSFRLEGYGLSMLLDVARARGMMAALELGLNRIADPEDRA